MSKDLPQKPDGPIGPVKPAARVTIAALVALTVGLGILTAHNTKLPQLTRQTNTKTAVPASDSNPQPDTTDQAVANVPIPTSPALYTVARTIDGDTIDVRTSTGAIERVRFIGVDTPETHDPRKPVQCFGLAAAAYTKDQLLGKTVRLEADPQDSDRDKYHRLLRYVYLPDNTLYNLKLIQEGYGFAYVVFPYAKMEDFRSAERQARESNRGLWAGCNVDTSQTIKQTTSGKN